MTDAQGAASGNPADAHGRQAADAVAALSRGLPGGIGISRLRVYDWEASDGLRGGSPHLHTASTEGYIVLAGSGLVETLSSQGLQRTPLEPGAVVWFTPGTVHRLVNADGALDILTLMSNAGLPEAGDAVLAFPLEVLRDPARYREHATLPALGDQETMAAAARVRRDLALEGFAQLRDRAVDDLDGVLRDLYSAAAALVSPRVSSWEEIVAAGPGAGLDATARQLASLAAGDPGQLGLSGIRSVHPDGVERWGMCGRLTVWGVGAH
ncbi:cupin domain-containing protein [Rathayibacter sp. CAU 1779]